MVMTAAVVLMFVSRYAVVKGDFARESTFSEQFESAIDSSDPDAGIALTHELVKLFDGQMLVGFEECEQNSIALLGPFQTDAFEMLLKTILRLAQPFLRDRDRIIDAFLQHFRAFLA